MHSCGIPLYTEAVMSSDPIDNQSKPAKAAIPVWAWLFAGACAIIPILTLGGALPAALGFGGAAGVVAVARNPSMSTGARIAACLGITVVVWILFAVLLGGIAALTS